MPTAPFATRSVTELPAVPGPKAGVTVLREPSVRAIYTWTPALIRSAEVAATGGNLRIAADLCEWMIGDDRIQAVLETRADALLGLDFSLVERGDARRSKAVCAALDSEWETSFPEAELRKLLAWGQMLGVGLGQLVWDEDPDTGRWTMRLETWSPRWLAWDSVRHTWTIDAIEGGAPLGSAPTGRYDITPGDGQWILYTPHGPSRPWVWGAYRALSRWALLKDYARNDWGFYSERLGQGVWVVESDPTKGGMSTGTEAQRKELAGDLQGIGRNTGIALQPGQTLRLVESVARTQENFKAQIDAADNGYAIALLGQNLSTQAGSGGSIGSATLHGKVAHGRTRMDGKTLPTCLRSQAVVHWAEINYGEAALAPSPWWDTSPVDDDKARAATKMAVAQADAVGVGSGVRTVDEIRAERGLPPRAGSAASSPAPGLPIASEPEREREPEPDSDAVTRPTAPPQSAPREPIELAPTDLAAVVRVDEARASHGLPAWGDADGELSVVAFKARFSSEIAKVADAESGDDPSTAGPPPPEPADPNDDQDPDE